MRRLLILPAALLALGLVLPGCAGVGNVVSAITQPIANPVTQTNTHQAKLAFAASQELVLKYQRDCFGSQLPPYPVTYAMIKGDRFLSIECSRRVSRYNVMKVAENRAYNAIVVADNFIKRNPTGNAVSYVSAAWKAVTEYRARAGG